MKTILEILAAGEYQHTAHHSVLVQSNTRGLWSGTTSVEIDHVETIHGNRVTITYNWLQVGATGKIVAGDYHFRAHGRSRQVTGDRMIEELRKHI